MYELCIEHHNKIERVCINPECQYRALCLLCDHSHGSPFQSIMTKKSQSYKTFELIINQAIDKYFVEKEQSAQQQIKQEQFKQVKMYFSELREQMDKFLNLTEKKTLDMIATTEEQDFMIIKKARIQKNYIKIPDKIFKILLQIYEGLDFSDIFKNSESSKAEQVYHQVKQLHESISSLMQTNNFKMKVKLPDFRLISIRQPKRHIQATVNYEVDQTKKTFQAKLVKQSDCQFDSIQSDSLRIKNSNLILSTSYDKKLRVFNERLQLKNLHQYSNILTKIDCIADDVYSIASSKEILIESIKYQNDVLSIENIMKLKGHSERINDLHHLNSRIIASSSLQAVKIWDLYKQKCQYTLKDEANPTCIRLMPSNHTLVVGFNNHYLKLYSIQNMKLIKKYQLSGVPLIIDQGKCAQNIFYVGSFKSNLNIIDQRLSKISSEFVLNSDAPTCLADSMFDQQALAVGDRGGNVSLVDLRTKKTRICWMAHFPRTNLSKPRGVVSLHEQSQDKWISVGCNDRCLKLWEITTEEEHY